MKFLFNSVNTLPFCMSNAYLEPRISLKSFEFYTQHPDKFVMKEDSHKPYEIAF